MAVGDAVTRPELHLLRGVGELETKLIEQALELEGGNISRAAERLGLKRQTLSNMLTRRHKKLFYKRTPPVPRLKSIIKKEN